MFPAVSLHVLTHHVFLSTWLQTVFWILLSILAWRMQQLDLFYSTMLRYWLFFWKKLISPSESRKSVAFSFFFSKHNIMQGQCICCWFCYLAIFLSFISEAWLKLVIYLLLFSPVLLWRKHPINRGFGGVRYHIGASRLSCHRSACVAVCEGFRPAALKHLSKLNTVHRIKNTCNQEKEVQRMLRRRREEKLRPIGVCFTTMTWRRIHCIYIYCLNSNAL